jgi:hypothetical protein
MNERFQHNNRPSFQSFTRIKDVSIIIPQIRAEFYVRLYSLLEIEPEVTDEGYDIFIEDVLTGKSFSAGLSGFGPGYFAVDESAAIKQLIEDFHDTLFNTKMEMKDCQMEFEHDFGKTILGFKNGKLIEQDILDE